MSKSKRKGSEFERQVAEYMALYLGNDGIERRALAGVNDRGDVAGVKFGSSRVVVECKAAKEFRIGEWLEEAETERRNDLAAFGVVVSKRRGVGESRTGEQLVCMTLETFCKFLKGEQ